MYSPVLWSLRNCARKIPLNGRFRRHQCRTENKKTKTKIIRKTPVRLQFSTGHRQSCKHKRGSCAGKRVRMFKAEIVNSNTQTACPHVHHTKSIDTKCVRACSRMGCFKSYRVIAKRRRYCIRCTVANAPFRCVCVSHSVPVSIIMRFPSSAIRVYKKLAQEI